MKYWDQLDSLRTVAILMTILLHFVLDLWGINIPYMTMGVDLFFFISGFLITSILLKTKEYSVNSPRPLKIIKNFIIKRALRLFPIYYLYLLFFLLLFLIARMDIGDVSDMKYYFTYTTNFLIYYDGWRSKMFNHLWSLSVEEQFYLIWPWIVIFTNPKQIKYILLAIILISIVLHGFYDKETSRMLLPANFHTLGAGALLGYLMIFHKEHRYFLWLAENSRRMVYVLLPTFILYLVITYQSNVLPGISSTIRELLLCVTSFFLILSTVEGWEGSVFNHFFSNKQIQYIGRISYGIYLYHKPIPLIGSFVLRKLGWINISPLLLFGVYFVITITVASISYKLVETPFLNLKRKFDN
jgi:peptidoglycan/LPS O-acetylase OafA/YrhL